jgi:hypothetical protein
MTRIRRAALVAALAAFATPTVTRAADLSWSGLAGYQQGYGLRILGTVSELAPDFPIGFQFGFGYTLRDPGNPAAARAVFINDNTNGTADDMGAHVWDLRADVVWLIRKAGKLENVGIFAGPRYSMFTGRFRFVGGNEDFLVESNSVGVGAGLRGELRLGARWSLAAALGVDWFPKTSIYSHDATYASSGASTNARAKNGDAATYGYYGWADADRAVNQPKLVPSVLLGVAWRP